MKFLVEIILVLIMLEMVRRWIIKALELEEKNRRLQEKLSAMEKLYEEMQEEIEITKKYRHDMKKHIHLLEGLLAKYNDAEISSVSAFPQKFNGLPQKNMYCENIFIDTICTLKKKQCAEKGITMFVDIHFEEFVPMKEMDISGLLQNLLDNAIEASERIKGKNKKEIYLLIMENTEGWILKVSNFCDNPEQINFQTTKRDKKNHGYGIGIICDIVKQYNGTIKYVKSEEEKQVTVHIFFPKGQKKIL